MLADILIISRQQRMASTDYYLGKDTVLDRLLPISGRYSYIDLA